MTTASFPNADNFDEDIASSSDDIGVEIEDTSGEDKLQSLLIRPLSELTRDK